MSQSRCIMKIMKNDEAVSPVIGTILMVAITVILAAVIAAFVFGMVVTTTTTKTVGMTVVANQTDSAAFKITFTGGPDLSSVDALIINYDNQAKDLSDDTNVAGDEAGNETVSVVNGPGGKANKIALESGKRFAVGNLLNVKFSDTTVTTVSGHRITIIGVFTDGAEQILWDRTL